ncbi:MFS transporter [Streptomyces sp. NBC_01764]|uniref:MFS transporter n=1 Tax=Streptomyces sp. NBC_01764 TaxID=2975935 RepID=UPI0022503E4F|nr:MFS transporter [Streptomyces sp. NBC_01764]MCX4404318.1 MFS transporter [Streptomyces sp. NBC_01764]
MASISPTPEPDPRRWRALGIICLVQVMLLLDVTVVNVALPPIQRDLGFTTTGLAWVVNGYTVTYGGLLMLGGRLGDLLGRRRLFLIGLAVFALSSATAGIAQQAGVLVASRFVQGIGAALVSPAALSLVTLLFTRPQERARAMAIWSGLAGVGVALGVVLSGILTDLASWRWIFFINLPIAAFAFLATPKLVSESRAAKRGRPDVLGAILVTLGLLLLVFGLLEKGNHAWLSFSVLGCVGIGVVLLIGFVFAEARAAQPLVPLAFLRSRNRSIANMVRVCYYIGFATFFFSLSLYIQHILHFSTLATGYAFVPFGFVILFSATVVAPRLLPRFGLRTLNGGGLAISTIGYVFLAGLSAHGTYVADVLPGLILVPLGGGLVLVGSTVAGVDGATGEDAGIATSMNNASMQIGSAIGLAALVSLGTSHATVLQHAGVDPTTATARGYAFSFAVAAAVTAFGALLGFVGIHPTVAKVGTVRENAEQRAA